MPGHLSTSLERQFAAALGLSGKYVLRLPLEASACSQTAGCLWRWLARAAVEEVTCTASQSTGFPKVVANARAEFARLSAEEGLRKTMASQIKQDEAEIESLRAELTDARAELHVPRDTHAEVVRAQADNEVLRADNARHLSTARGLEKVAAAQQMQNRSLIDGDLAAMRRRAEEAEARNVEHAAYQQLLQRRLAQAEQDKLVSEVDASRLRVELEHWREKRSCATRRGLRPRGSVSARATVCISDMHSPRASGAEWLGPRGKKT